MLSGSGNDGSPLWRMHCVMARARWYGVFPPPSTSVCCGPGPLWHPAASITLPIMTVPRSVCWSDAGRRNPRMREAGLFILLVLVLMARSAGERVARKPR